MKDLSCVIGITLLIASLSAPLINRDKNEFKFFYNLLDDKQKDIYEAIISERLSIYFMGMILGLGLGIYYLVNNKKDKYKLCKFLMILYFVKFGFYYLYPKQPLMLYSLTTKDQVNSWATIYTEMKTRFKYSLIIGFIGYLLISMYFC
tara:strand:+ start:504 stop:947 length:444 start_codon:yes stop_codon:yes gene_type:complete